MRGRFLSGAVLLLLVLLASGLLAEYYLDHQQQKRAVQLEQRQETLATSRLLRNFFWDASQYLQLYALNPLPAYKRQAMRAIRRGQREAKRLAEMDWIQQYNQEETAQQLEKDFRLLQQDAQELVRLRTDPNKLFPTLGVMREELAPATLDFLSNSQKAIRSGAPAASENGFLFRQIRYLWSRMVAEFRLYMTARVGLLGGRENRSRARNLESFYGEISTLLTELERRRKRGTLNLVESRALDTLKQAHESWFAGYREVRHLHATRNWRTDFPLLRKSLYPRFQSIQGALLHLDKRLEASAANDTTAMSQVARRIAAIIWSLLLVHLIAVVVGYLALRQGLLAPLARMTRALKREAQGNPDMGALPNGPREIREVAEAFGVLRQEVRSREAALEHQAFHDPLTGLPNRALLEDRLEQAQARALRQGGTGALLMLDLDFFKEINDAFGHPVGDKVLAEVAARLQSLLRQSDTIARFGGDEFGVLLPDTPPKASEEVAGKILKVLQEKLEVGGRELHVGASIGIAHFPEHGEDVASLVRTADLAMYEAKRTRQGLVVFHPNHQSDVSERLTRINELFEDIHHARIPLHYQPKVDTASGTVVGAEALLRWGPGDSHLLPPPEVFAMAERAGVAQDLTLRVLNAAIRQCAAWRTAGWDLTIAVNLSVNDLQMPNLIDRVREGLSAWDLPARRLELEITENAMMAEPERAHRVLAELRALGIRIAVDDYGTGYSSLAYLKGLPVDVLKIDKSFVMELAEDPHDQAIVRSTVELGHSLGLEVVAEGVENEEGQALLTQWQCQRAQGFHLGRPMDPADFLRHVAHGPQA